MRSILTASASILIAAGLLVAPGCETAPEEMPYQTMDLAEPVPMSYKAIGGHPALAEPGVQLVSSQAQLDALGVDDLLGRAVNFNNDEVILATLGEMPTAGYWINITAVNQEGRPPPGLRPGQPPHRRHGRRPDDHLPLLRRRRPQNRRHPGPRPDRIRRRHGTTDVKTHRKP